MQALWEEGDAADMKTKRRLKFWATEMASRVFVLLMFALALFLFALGLYLLPREVRVVDQHDGLDEWRYHGTGLDTCGCCQRPLSDHESWEPPWTEAVKPDTCRCAGCVSPNHSHGDPVTVPGQVF